MNKILTILFGIIITFPSLISAGVLDELNHIPPHWDFIMYADVRAMFDYARKKGIEPDDLPFFMGEKKYHDAVEVMNRFNLKVSDVSELLAAGKLEDKKKDFGALFFIHYTGNTRPVPPEFRTQSIQTPYGAIYGMKEKDMEKMVLAQTRDAFVIGVRESVEYYLKSRKSRILPDQKRYGSFREQSKGKCFYALLSMSKIMKDYMDVAVQKGASLGKGLNSNVFVKSINALESLDAGIQIGNQLQFHGGMRASSKEDGERLMMVSHFFIVGSSLAISFIDLIGRNFGGEKSGGISEQDMETIQSLFGRIRTRQVDRGVLLSFNFTEQETERFVKEAKVKIAEEKNARGLRLEQEALVPFIEAIKNGNTAGISAFMAKRININGKDIRGNIPLNTACGTGRIDIVRLLVEKGAKIDSRDCEMKTPLHRAVGSGSVETVEFIIGRGASVEAKDISDKTPLHDNAVQGSARITALLLRKQAEVNVQTNLRDTPLHLAAENGHLDVVKILVEKGANINVYDNNGERPVDRALRNNKQDVVNYLNEHGGRSSDSEGIQEQEQNQNQEGNADY